MKPQNKNLWPVFVVSRSPNELDVNGHAFEDLWMNSITKEVYIFRHGKWSIAKPYEIFEKLLDIVHRITVHVKYE